MGLNFNGKPPAMGGKVIIEIPTPTYSGKKSSNELDSINPYTTKGPAADGGGQTEEEVNDGRGIVIPFPASMSNAGDNGESWFSSLLVGDFDITFTVDNFIDANIGRAFVRLLDENLALAGGNHYIMKGHFQDGGGVKRQWQSRNPDITSIDDTAPTDVNPNFRLWRIGNTAYASLDGAIIPSPWTDLTGIASVLIHIWIAADPTWLNKVENSVTFSGITGY